MKSIIRLLKQFIRITKKIKSEYDTIITVPSSNILNKEFLHKLNKIIKPKNVIEALFGKLPASEVMDVIDLKSIPETEREEIMSALQDMINNDNNHFSFKKIHKNLRKYIKQIYDMDYEDLNIEDDFNFYNTELKYAPEINDKNVLVLDDTITSGQTTSIYCEAIVELYAPKSLTIISLFSALDKDTKPLAEKINESNKKWRDQFPK